MERTVLFCSIMIILMMAWSGPPVSAEGKITITAQACKVHKLPPVSFSITPQGGAFIASRFPDKATYLMLSGPPGGVLNIAFIPYRDNGETEASLKSAIESRFKAHSTTPLIMGRIRDIDLKGSQYMALPFIAGTGPARGNWIAIPIPAEGEGLASMVIFCGVAASMRDTEPEIQKVFQNPEISKTLQTLELKTK
ncbi:MAG: hypothetical protein RDV48_23610 [Candidatus Eremiobacteraeota bacterium]|nr:hypothetical protein [Candidatus Eremiobacteraeota bacterium]